jgi:translocation and assembly module TamB
VTDLRRWTRWGLYLLVAVVAAFLVSLITIDLGPQLRGRAERAASAYLERPLHIQSLRAELWSGRVVANTVVIEGITPDATPFLKADRVFVSIPWWALLRRELILEVEIDRWEIQIESFPGRSSTPRIMPRGGGGSSTLKVTVNHVFARDGRFRYIDHVLPWDITCNNAVINFVFAPTLNRYVSTLGFQGGTVNIQKYQPMRVDAMSARLTVEGALLRVHQMTIVADGSRSQLTGTVNSGRWPEQDFNITSEIDVSRMKEIFFYGQNFTASGRGRYTGTFHKYQRTGYEVNGGFTSDVLRVSGLDFPDLKGHVVWVPNRLEVVNTESEFYGGTMKIGYALDTSVARGTVADLSVRYRDVDLIQFGKVYEWKGIALASRANGWHTMQWPSGRFAEMRGEGVLRAAPEDGRALATAVLPAEPVYAAPEVPFDRDRVLELQPTSGEITYTMTPDVVTFAESWAATAETYLSFSGATGWRDNANIPFRVVSTDWQSSDRLLAGVLTAFGSPTKAIEVGGRGEFDGVLTKWFNKPLITGRFEGDGIRSWDVVWGRARADLVIENSYVTVTNSLVGERDAPGVARMTANGRYSLGYPRADGGEQFDARIKIDDWPLVDFRHAFLLDDWPVTGTAFADLRLYGDYEGPEGFGLLTVSPGTGWEETFDRFAGRLSFERVGMRLDEIEMTKSTGVARGAAYIGWPGPQNNDWGTYSFTFDADRVPVESLVSFTVPDADLTGALSFKMWGSGSNERPRYEWDGRIVDLFWGDEGIGQATAHMLIEDDVVNVDRLDVASDRLSISGSGRLVMNDDYDVEATLRFSETSVDPFLRFAAPGLSPYTRAVVSGAVRVSGQAANLSHLGVDVTVDKADIDLLDFVITNPIGADGIRTPLRLGFVNDVLTLHAFRLTGEGTSLTLGGTVNRMTEALDVTVDGTSNLAILQGVIQDVRASGNAAISATIGGTFTEPSYGGKATLTQGRLRHYSFPHSLDEINGDVTFDASGIRLDGLRARMGTGGRNGSGDIRFGGTIGLAGFLPGELNLTLQGDGLDLRYPEGFRSIVDADLAVTGSVEDALLSGRVTVRQARYTRRLQGNTGLLGLAAVGGGGEVALPSSPGADVDLPITFAVDLVGQRLSVIDDADATVVVSPDLRFTGTLARPQLAGRVEIDRGDTEFLGNRYTIGGYVEFTNPNAIEPYFDLEARTQIRQPSQEYRIDLRFTGTMSAFTYDLSSDPPLTQVDVLSLILGQNPDLQRAELRAIESPQEVQNQLMSSVLAQLVASPITTQVGRVVERTLNVDTFTVTPLLSTEATLQQLPTARITVGKKISNRVFLTYSRSLDSSTSIDYDLLLLEYAQSERVSWVLSRNQDGTFALDFRVRYRF